MLKRTIRLSMILLVAFLATGCGVLRSWLIVTNVEDVRTEQAPEVGSPPTVYLVVNGIEYPMDLGSYCWSSGNQGICADAMPPDYSGTSPVVLPEGASFNIRSEEPAFNSSTLSFYPGTSMMDAEPEYTIYMRGIPEPIEWQSPVDSGQYVLTVFAHWLGPADEVLNDATYTLPVMIER